MWVAKDKNDKCIVLFENCPIRHEESGEWVDIAWTDSGHEVCCLGHLPENMFPNLQWEDEPIEVGIHQINPLYKMTCPHCHKDIKYHRSDIKTNYYCQEATGYEEEWYTIDCPECGKCIEV